MKIPERMMTPQELRRGIEEIEKLEKLIASGNVDEDGNNTDSDQQGDDESVSADLSPSYQFNDESIDDLNEREI